MKRKSEYQRAFEILLKPEDKLRESGVPEEQYELLLRLGHSKISNTRDIEEVLEVIEKLCELL